jgi:hypothetical protein
MMMMTTSCEIDNDSICRSCVFMCVCLCPLLCEHHLLVEEIVACMFGVFLFCCLVSLFS